MEVLWDVLAFGLKTSLLVVGIVMTVGLIVSIARSAKRTDPYILVKDINSKYRDFADTLRFSLLGKKEAKKASKDRAKQDKKAQLGEPKPALFVVDFEGDVQASSVKKLREEISTVLSVAGENDEVVVRVESSGGQVHAYGLAASQLTRIKDKGVKLTVCVDKVAASGGYMMACVADQILAAPFAIVGSIGVLAPVPNLHKFLKKHDVEYEELTAGEYKRTMSMLAENTKEGREKFMTQLEETHTLFKDFVSTQRPKLDLEKVATGEYWFGSQAKELNLVDKLQTSDAYIMSRLDDAQIREVVCEQPPKFKEKLAEAMGSTAERAIAKGISFLQNSRVMS